MLPNLEAEVLGAIARDREALRLYPGSVERATGEAGLVSAHIP